MTEDLAIALASQGVPVPKYRMGQKVFCSRIRAVTEMLPCPDCLGSRKWKIITPAGTELQANCERCATYNNLRGVPSLKRNIWKPEVQALTIGAVEIKTGWGHDVQVVRYMAVETGIGSGSVYDEKDLHAEEADARSSAQSRADAENSKAAEKPKRIEQQSFSHLTIADAAIRAASDAVYSGWDRLNSLVSDIEQAASKEEGLSLSDFKEEVERHIDFDREYRAQHDPFENLLRAARHAVEVTDLPDLAEALAAKPFDIIVPSLTKTEA